MKTKANFQVVTVFPEMIASIFAQGVVFQAVKKDLLNIESINPRQFTLDVHKSVDDRPFGGGDGMILMTEPLSQSLQLALKNFPTAKVIYLSPQGKPLTDAKVFELAQRPQLILICGRYGGIDQRVINEYVHEEISIGDYVLSGGELAAAVLIDAVSRQIPGVLGNAESAGNESFRQGVLEAPLFTRPQDFNGKKVPEILMSGHHAKIQVWHNQVSKLITWQKRPDLFTALRLTHLELQSLKDFWQSLPVSDREVLGLLDFQPEFL